MCNRFWLAWSIDALRRLIENRRKILSSMARFDALPSDVIALIVSLCPDSYWAVFSLNRHFYGLRNSGSCVIIRASYFFLQNVRISAAMLNTLLASDEGEVRDIFITDEQLANPAFDIALRDDYLEQFSYGAMGNVLASSIQQLLLHRCAALGSPLNIARALLLGAPHMVFVRDKATGRTPAELAMNRGHRQLAFLLHPRVFCGLSSRPVFSPEQIAILELHLHNEMRSNRQNGAAALIERHGLADTLPRIAPLMAYGVGGVEGMRLWYPIAGMYGGYGVRIASVADLRKHISPKHRRSFEETLFGENVEFGLLCDSFVRVSEGSEEYHYITERGIRSAWQEQD